MLDANRGLTKRKTPGGLEIAMYKDAPGEFFYADGSPATVEHAKAAHFDVSALERERLKRQMLEEAHANIEERLAEAEANIEQQIISREADPDAAPPLAGYESRHMGAGKFAVFGPDGERLTPQPLTKEQAESVLAQLEASVQEDSSDGT